MLIIDKALDERQRSGNPIRVGMVGAGFMARGIALQIVNSTPGMKLVAIANRHLDGARRAYHEAGLTEIETATSVRAMSDAIARGRHVITDDALVLAQTPSIDVVVEVTGTIEYAAGVVTTAIDHGKHVVLMNAELDGTLGPILKMRADKAGVIITNSDGDQPGVIMNLYRFVKGIGVRPVLCGNIKGLHDPYRNPTTQQDFARQWKQNPTMVTSFADGSKISFEQAIVANATAMRVAKRGMFGRTVPTGTSIMDVPDLYPLDQLLTGNGIVDYVVGAVPSPGVFVLGVHDHPTQQHYLNLYKLGTGPLYCFYTPYHLCHFEAPNTIARAALFNDATITPLKGPCVDVVATAKIDLKAGQCLDQIGGYCLYGLAENADTARAERLLPIGLAEGCVLRRDVPKDQALTYDDVDVPAGRLCDQLRAEQDAYFAC